MLIIPQVDEIQRYTPDQVGDGDEYEGETAGGVIILFNPKELDKTYVIEYEYTEDNWYGVIRAVDASPSEFAYDPDGAEDALLSKCYAEASRLINEYQSGAMDFVGSLREANELDGAEILYQGELQVDTWPEVEATLIGQLESMVR